MRTPQKELAAAIESRRAEIALLVSDEHFRRRPELRERYGAIGYEKCRQDAEYHLLYLSQALRSGSPVLFSAYAQWAAGMLAGRKIPADDLRENLSVVRDFVTATIPASASAVAEYTEAAVAALSSAAGEDELLRGDTPHGAIARAYLDALLKADRPTAMNVIAEAVRNGMSIRDLYLDVFEPVQHHIGYLWQTNQISVAEEHYCTAATQTVIATYYAKILSARRVGRKAVVAAVGNELHELGARMVADFFEMEGWDTVFVGANTPAGALLELVCREKPHVVGVAATMTYHVGAVEEQIRLLRNDPRCSNAKILVGGYPFNVDPELWRAVGADGCARNAEEAVRLATELVGR